MKSVTLTAAIFAAIFATPLAADGLSIPPIKNAEVAKECSACHMLYPAGLLPARSWDLIMGDLKNHFGDNAELDPALAQRMAVYLKDNAADTGGRGGKLLRDLSPSQTPKRITDLPWFKRKHEKKDRISPATLKRKGAKFPGDCKACHTAAEKGTFDDD
ncbi:MAG: diheme cytochrome c [Hyphomicrobiaceae bacterium]